ncbi:alpha/beta hydrolase [Shimia sp.]|uniref:alpha/beta hydrolase n=1 Tax=Shimia sp. TaxID=1954381 RepID=UPI00329A3D09
MTLVNKFLPVVILLLLAACSSTRVLAPTPNVFANGGYPQSDVAPALQTTQSSIFYITDRMPELKDDALSYGSERSSSMAFGVTDVSFGEDGDWPSLTAASGAVKRDMKLPLSIVENREVLRFDPTPIPFKVKNGRPERIPEAVRSYNAKRADFQAQVRKEMRRSGKSEVVVFVHGFNNSFEDAVFSLADIWHFSGRKGVPIAYSWPAGAGGLFGYFTDRESGEFTVFHLKEFLTQLSQIPELRKIHIVAHSRGTDVTTTALREMIIAVNNQGKNPKTVLKIENLILAAPDLDFSVVRQRLVAEGFGAAIGQITVFMNPGDSALGLSQRLMTGQRFGRLEVEDINPAEKEIFSEVRTVNFVNVEGVRGLTGHAYYRTNPNVLSDIAILIRNGGMPGSSLRPMTRIEGNFWTMSESYPF